MTTPVKALFAVLLGIFIVVGLIVVAVSALFNPNDYKEDIRVIAQEQGIDLQLKGDIGWQFFPNIGLRVNNISVAPTNDANNPIASLEALRASVALMPLIEGRVRIAGIEIIGAKAYLVVDKNGKGNWEALGGASSSAETDSETEPGSSDSGSTQNLDLAMDLFRIRNADIEYIDQQTQQRFSLKDFDLNMRGLNLAGRSFPLQASWTVSASTLAEDIDFEWETDIAISPELNAAALNNLKLQIDQTTFKGEASASDLDQETPLMALRLIGDRLDIDPYLASPEGTQGAATAAPDNSTLPASTGDEVLLPLGTLRALAFDLELGLDELKASGLALSAVKIKARGRNGLIEMQSLDADFYQGTIAGQASLDARSSTARMEKDLRIENIEIAALIDALEASSTEKKSEDGQQLSGRVNAKLKANTRGLSINQMTDALVADINFGTEQLQVAPLNLEQQFCEAAALLSKDTETLEQGEEVSTDAKTWPALTKLRDLQGLLTIREQRLDIETLSAGVENMELASQGFFDLKNKRYDLNLPLTLKGENSSADGCRIKSEFVRNRPLSFVRCKGSTDTPGAAGDCGLDKKALRDLTKDLAKYKAQKKLGDKKDKLLDKAKDKLGEDTVDKLKGLFGR